MRDQFVIIEDVLLATVDAIEGSWLKLIVDYYIDESQSGVLKSFLAERAEGLAEIPIGYVADLEPLMRELRSCLSANGSQAFTRCTLMVDSTGKYETAYQYDQIVWSSLLQPDWNFPEALIKG